MDREVEQKVDDLTLVPADKSGPTDCAPLVVPGGAIVANCNSTGVLGQESAAPDDDLIRAIDERIDTLFSFIQGSFSVGIIAVIAFMILLSFYGMFHVSHSDAAINDAAFDFINTSMKHVSILPQVMGWLPAAALLCIAMTFGAGSIWRDSRSRQIDWTDSHLFLEYTGPLSLVIKWTSIESVTQSRAWDLLHGKQPVFIVKTRGGNEFKLKLSDITLKNEVGTFFSLIKTNAPDAQLNVDPSFSTDNSYTELWLKYFSTPAQRGRTTGLEADMLVDNGRYKILNTIGGGGQGTAYLAGVNDLCAELEMAQEDAIAPGITQHIIAPDKERLSTLDTVVLKEYVLPVHRGQLTAERTAEKLRLEAEILKKLEHPQIVKLEDAFIEDFRGYLVLEYVEGEQLKSLVERLGPQPEQAVIDWAIQTCDILAYLHTLSPPVVHRDITPDNLLLQEDGKLKLIDFNVAYQVDSSATATVVGKHAYIPAEQFRGKPVPQSDIYSLGGTIHFLLTGKEPEPITRSSPRSLNAKLSEQINAIVETATSSEPANRFASVQEMAQALRAIPRTD